MSVQSFLKTLKTAKRSYPNSVYKLLIASSSYANPNLDSTKLSLSNFDLPTLRQILSDPDVKSSKCVSLFGFVLENPSLFSFQPDLRAHLTLTFRVLSQRKFSVAAKLLKFLAVDEILRYPFRVVASSVDECCYETKTVSKFFNLMLKVYSDNGKSDEAIEVFEYMKDNGVKIDERTCTVHLINLKKYDHVELADDFFNLMVESGIKVSVYSLTVMVCTLCGKGEIKRARELVEEMLLKGTKPCVITYKAMIDCCTKRWNFEELDLVLKMMQREGEEFNLDTYKILIDGFSSYGKVEEAERLVSEMHDKRLRTGVHLYNVIMNGYSRLGLVEETFELQRKMIDRGVSPNGDTYWFQMKVLCKAGRVDEALSLLSELQMKGIEIDEAMFSALIEGCCRKGMVDKGFEMFVEMQREGFMADAALCNKIADELSDLNRVEVKMMVTHLAKRGVKPKDCYFGTVSAATWSRTSLQCTVGSVNTVGDCL